MKKLLVLALLLAVCVSASAQEKRQHAIEITTGYPSLAFSAEYPWLQGEIELGWEGLKVKEYYQPCLNIGCTFTKKKRWETNVVLNLHLTISDYMKYPMISEGDEFNNPRYNWDAEPILDHRDTELWGALAISFRYKWIAKENVNLYSAFGLGVSMGLFPIPLPYLAPLGIKFGKGKVYGLAELNVSPISTYGIAGIGIRL